MGNKTKVFSVRISETEFKALKNKSIYEKLTVNSLINKILDDYLDWHSKTKDANIMPIHKGLLKTMIAKFSDREIKCITKEWMLSENKQQLLNEIMFDDKEEKLIIKNLETFFLQSGFSFRVKYMDKKYSYTIIHDMGKNVGC